MNNAEKLIALNGGKTVQVGKTDGSTENVLVRQVSVRSYLKLMEFMGDEPKLVCMVCDKPDEWIDSLTPDGYELIVATFEEINGDFFKRWARRMLKRQEAIAPGLVQKFMGGEIPTLRT